MKKRLIASILGLSVLVFPFAPIANASFGPLATTGDIIAIQNQLTALQSELQALEHLVSQNEIFGATNNTQPIAGTNYSLAGSGISATVSSIVLSSFTITQTGAPITSAMLSKNFYVTLEPGNNARQEIASCTSITQNSNGSATLTGCSRGLLPFTPYTASSTYAFPHGGGTTLILSNPPQLYNELAALGNTETITGAWTFASSSLPQVSQDTTNAQIGNATSNLATVGYANNLVITGAPASSNVVPGIGLTATTTQLQASTQTGTVSTTAYRYFVASASVASTSRATSIPLTNASGTLPTNFVAQSATDNYNFLGSVTSTVTVLNGATSLPNIATGSILEISSTTHQIVGVATVPAASLSAVQNSGGGASCGTQTFLGLATSTFSTGANYIFITANAVSSDLSNGQSSTIEMTLDGSPVGNQPTVKCGLASCAADLGLSTSYVGSVSAGSHTVIMLCKSPVSSINSWDYSIKEIY